MAAITVTGTVTKCELKTTQDVMGADRYDAVNGKERYLCRLNLCVVTAEGKRYFFDTPAARKTVSCPAGCPAAIVLYWLDSETVEGWFAVSEGSGVATRERAETRRLLPKVQVGDVITVRGSVKAEKETYTALNRVRLLKVEPAAVEKGA